MLDVIPRPLLALLAVAFVARLAWRALVAHSRATETSLNESARMSERPAAKHASTCVVVGAGIAGTLSAATAALHFERVVLVDPVAWDGDAHAHIAQLDQANTIGPMVVNCLRGLYARDTLADALQQQRGRTYSFYDCPAEFNSVAGMSSISNKTAPKTDDALASLTWLCLSRRAAQRMMRALLQHSTPGVEVLHGKVTAASFADEQKTRITSVQVATTTATITIPCALLIDCSGPARMYRSLLQHTAPLKQDTYRMQMTYATAHIDVHPSLVARMPMTDEGRLRGTTYERAGIMSILFPALSPLRDFFLTCRFEGHSMALCNMSYDDKRHADMPSTLDEYAAHYRAAHSVLRGCDAPAWFDAMMDVLRENEEVRGEKTKFIKLRENESWCLDLRGKQDAMPDNVVLLGDTYCKLNPAFGQGTQKAASEVMILHSVLLDHAAKATAEKPVDFKHVVQRFNKQRHPVTFHLFEGHRAIDFSQSIVVRNNPSVSPDVGKDVRFLTRGWLKYICIKQDRRLMDLFANVIFAGAEPPALLLHPNNLFRILYGALVL